MARELSPAERRRPPCAFAPCPLAPPAYRRGAFERGLARRRFGLVGGFFRIVLIVGVFLARHDLNLSFQLLRQNGTRACFHKRKVESLNGTGGFATGFVVAADDRTARRA